jgi:hypothetical protein
MSFTSQLKSDPKAAELAGLIKINITSSLFI